MMQGSRLTTLFIAFCGLICFFGLNALLEHTQRQQQNKLQALLVQEAEAHFSTIKNLQIWHEKFGGVFQPSDDQDQYHFEIFSINPKSHFNKAHGFAEDGLQAFERDQSLFSYYRFSSNQQDFDFIGALYVENRCLACHTQYQLGDVRGGIKINIPLDNYRSSLQGLVDQYLLWQWGSGLVLLTLTIALILFIRHILMQKEAIRSLNSSLEIKVRERTQEVRNLYNREHYLKDLLGNLSEINEALISSYSMSSIIQASVEKLNNHPNYRLMMFANYDGSYLHIRELFGDKYALFPETDLSLEQVQSNPLLLSTFNALIHKKSQIEVLPDFDKFVTTRSRADDYTLYASVSIPMLESAEDTEFSVLTLWTDRKVGFDHEEVQILNSVAQDVSMALSAFKQRQMTERLQQEQITNYEETILAFVDMIEQRDAYTAGHTLRVAKYSRMIADEVGLEESLIQKLEKAAILHDIGKIATPDTILLKPGRLTRIEYDLIKQHVSAGYKMLSKVKMYAELAELIKYHHEHYDGSGYPEGVSGDQIPMEAHILIVADAFDAMTTNRIYKTRLSIESAISELVKLKGKQFHPDIVDAAVKRLSDIELEQTSQLPRSELESQRFSYFFTDSLTGLFNVAYFKLVLNQAADDTYIKVIRLGNFSAYNHKQGWQKGDELLIHVARKLEQLVPAARVFRFEGDDFILFADHPIAAELSALELQDLDPDQIIEITEEEYSAVDRDSLDAFTAEIGA